MPNEAEILALTNRTSLSQALELLDPHTNIIVVKRGLNGAVAYQKGTYMKPHLTCTRIL